MFNESLTAIGGRNTRKVEVYEGGIWNDQRIQPIKNKGDDGARYGIEHFTSLAIKHQLYVFGNISIFNQTWRREPSVNENCDYL